jgi:hypothetical protein
MTKVEDLINTTFLVILYIIVFKMIYVFNLARCDTAEELKKRNSKVEKLYCIVICLIVITQAVNIVIDIGLFGIQK